MKKLPKALSEKLQLRKENNSFRGLTTRGSLVDFVSNDYLGFAQNEAIQEKASRILKETTFKNGSTGSRLVSGTHALHGVVEKELAKFHNTEAALLFNSGYDANVGLFSAILQKGATILYDELIHASIRDGIRLSNAKSYRFKHNSIEDLKKKFSRCEGTVYIAIESVYSMDGDTAPVKEFVHFSNKNNCYLIVDEAHSNGVFGNKGAGLLQDLDLEKEVFARIHTFGKALGCHGAVVLGSQELRDYLINFSRSFIYTTAASLHSIATIKAAYLELETTDAIFRLQQNIAFFRKGIQEYNLEAFFIDSHSAIHCCVISGNKKVKKAASFLEEKGLDVKAILSPTVLEGEERLRICLHAYNTEKEMVKMLKIVKELIAVKEEK